MPHEIDDDARAGRCLDDLRRLRAELLAAERGSANTVVARAGERGPSVRNFLHYLALRRRDIRPLQEDLTRLGLSSLGRAESHVLCTVEAVLRALEALTGRPEGGSGSAGAPSFTEGPRHLEANTDALLGPRPDRRDVRIMVTLPAEAALDRPFVTALLERGMDLVRINCAHDDPDIWAQMSANVRDACAESGRRCRVQMDLGGPKLRTGVCDVDLVLRSEDLVVLTRSQAPGASATVDADAARSAHIPCSLPEVLDDVHAGDRVFFDDGKIGGTVEVIDAEGAHCRITRARPKGSVLRADKGINLPDSSLRLPALGAKDRADLMQVVRLADIVALSFVQRPEDVAEIEEELARLEARDIGLVLKIETRRGFAELPNILLAAIGARPLGVMIARGDMAVECGYERLAEIQEEMLWLCESAHVPVIWATEVLDRLSRKGLPTRAEITDAAMSERAECVMLNKGPYVLEAISLLDRILRRMEGHQYKKIATLRPLAVAKALP